MLATALFLHVVSAIGIFATLAVEWILLDRVRAAPTRAAEQEAARAFSVLPRIGAPSTALVLVTGLYLTAAEGVWSQGWPVLSIAGLVIIGVTGAVFGSSRPMASLARGGRPPDGRPPTNGLRKPLWARVAIALGIVALMTFQPGVAGSAEILGATVVLGAACMLWPSGKPSKTTNGTP